MLGKQQALPSSCLVNNSVVLFAVLQAAAALSCVYFRESMSAGLVGVVMVQSFSSIRAFRLTLKTYVDVESKMT